LNKLTAGAKSYITFHVLVTCLILYNVILCSNYSISFSLVIPFIFFGSIFEFFRLDAFDFGGETYNISVGSAIIVAAIMLFNPLELIIFAFCYGLSILIFPTITEFSKIIFNLCETINVTFVAYLVWNSLHLKNQILLSNGNLLPSLVTVFVFVMLDIVSVSFIVSIASKTSLLKIWRESLDWVVVNDSIAAFIGWILASVYINFSLYGLFGFILPMFLMQYNMRLFAKSKQTQSTQLKDYNELLKDNNEQLLITLSHIIDARENNLLGHSLTVAKYATAIGKKLNLTTEEMYDLKRGSLLHDIGKLGISEAILQKPGKLTQEEFTVIKEHSLIGYKILEDNKGMEKVAEIVIQHHEQYSGGGYPNQLKAEEILLEARIVALCDALDTMLSIRSYKEGWPIEKAVAELVRCRGTHFDPMVVDAFMELKNELEDSFFSNSFKS
jgi:putative nucleotidyltransferase with HDIG domain